jgi:hypothetical protein
MPPIILTPEYAPVGCRDFMGLDHFVGDDCPGGHAEEADAAPGDIVLQVEEAPRHGSPRFHEILNELGALHDKKQKDYGTAADPFANVRGSKEWGVDPWVGALIRATDKLRRLQKFARYGELANEAVEDSFRDLAVYAIIGLVLYEETQEVTNVSETE